MSLMLSASTCEQEPELPGIALPEIERPASRQPRFRSGSSHVRHVRSIFLGDAHLGCRHAQSFALLRFLQSHRADHIYLVGDFIDGMRLKRAWHWRPQYNAILQRLWDMQSEGATLHYTPGNHDAFLRDFVGDYGWIEIADEFVHPGIDGRSYLVTHGDLFDSVELCARWLSTLGAAAYDAMISLNALVARARGEERGPLAFSAWMKRSVKQAVRFVSRYERRLAEHARERRCEGVICGHIHTPILERQEHGVIYRNTGDWVESCTALLERHDGEFEICRSDFGAPAAQPCTRLPDEALPAPLRECVGLV